MAAKKQRNGIIELMRFVFCIIIILYHINNRIHYPVTEHFSLFQNGKIGVEFFFLVSGYLMAGTAKRHYDSKNKLKETERFIYKKFLSILPYHLIAFGAALVVYFAFDKKLHGVVEHFEKLVSFLPNFFFLQKSGIYSVELLTAEWYLAAMLITMLILYPLILKYQDKFTKLACPLIMILLIGYMAHATDKLGGMNKFLISGTVSKAYLRAIAEMAGGVFCYEIAALLRRLHFTKLDRFLLTVAEAVCYVLPILYACSVWEEKYEIYAFYSLAIAVTLSFSEVSLLNNVMKNGVCYYLGKMSLPVYMCQGISFLLMTNLLKERTDEVKIIFVLAATFLMAMVLEWLSGLLMKLYYRKLNRLTGR